MAKKKGRRLQSSPVRSPSPPIQELSEPMCGIQILSDEPSCIAKDIPEESDYGREGSRCYNEESPCLEEAECCESKDSCYEQDDLCCEEEEEAQDEHSLGLEEEVQSYEDDDEAECYVESVPEEDQHFVEQGCIDETVCDDGPACTDEPAYYEEKPSCENESPCEEEPSSKEEPACGKEEVPSGEEEPFRFDEAPEEGICDSQVVPNDSPCSVLDNPENTPGKYPAEDTGRVVDDCEISPYETSIVTLCVGDKRKTYTVQRHYLDQHIFLASMVDQKGDHIHLPDVDSDFGHTLVHYLYTGGYQTLRRKGVAVDDDTFIQTCRPCCGGKGKNKILSNNLLVFEVLDLVEHTYLKLLECDPWFLDHLESRIKSAFEEDETLFTQPGFLKYIGQNVAFSHVLVKTMVEIYVTKITTMATKPDGKKSSDESKDQTKTKTENWKCSDNGQSMLVFGSGTTCCDIFGSRSIGWTGTSCTTTPFGADASTFSGKVPQCQGTRIFPFSEYREKDPSGGHATDRFQTITALQAHQPWSLEELRLADYSQ